MHFLNLLFAPLLKRVIWWHVASQVHLACSSRAVSRSAVRRGRGKRRAGAHPSSTASKAFPMHQSQQPIFSACWFHKRKLHLEVALRAQQQEFVLKRPEVECYNHQADWWMRRSNTYCSQKPGAAVLAKRLITSGCELEPHTQQPWGFCYSLANLEMLLSPV